MPSTLLAIARGHLKGKAAGKLDREEKAQRDLENAIRLSQMEGITLEDPEVPAPVVPEPVIPGPAGSQVAQNAVLNAARGAWQTSAAGDQPDPAAIAPAMGGTKAPPPAPRNVLELGHLALGGQKKRIVMDPSQTTGGRRRTAEKENKSAFDRVNADGSLGAYDPGVDYRGKERERLSQAEIERELVASGVDEKDAHLLAQHHVDMEGRRRKTTAEDRAETREERIARLAQESLDERKRHNRAVEGKTTGKGGPLSKTASVAFGQVQRQIGERKTAVTAAQKEKPKNPLAEMGIFMSPADSTEYVGAKARSDVTVDRLQAEIDSLRPVSDSLAGVIQRGENNVTGKAATDTTKKKPPLTAADRARAATDPKFKAWLQAQGIL